MSCNKGYWRLFYVIWCKTEHQPRYFVHRTVACLIPWANRVRRSLRSFSDLAFTEDTTIGNGHNFTCSCKHTLPPPPVGRHLLKSWHQHMHQHMHHVDCSQFMHDVYKSVGSYDNYMYNNYEHPSYPRNPLLFVKAAIIPSNCQVRSLATNHESAKQYITSFSICIQSECHFSGHCRDSTFSTSI